MDIYSVIQSLIQKATTRNLIEERDQIYVRNQLIALLKIIHWDESHEAIDVDIPDLLEDIVEYAVETGLIRDLLDEKEIFSSKLMDIFMPRPSDLNRTFIEIYKENPQKATSFFYELSKNSNYIQTKRIAKNISFQAETTYGELDITINLSKPEKDPKQIAMEKEMKVTDSNYPKCLLCMANEGYEGRIGYPARSNHRLIPMQLSEEQWFLQYSPYVYYNEHCILFSSEHRDMRISRETFSRLLSFVEQFPHYFAGSNADLPIVGGSILSHDHYQGGNYEFAMARAEEEYSFSLDAFPNVKAGTIKWPMSVIRLRGKNKEELTDAAEFILNEWASYSDPSVDILSHTEDKRHNTITPISRYKNNEFELDLVLRNNRANDQHPLGIFHPHEDVHHIKKENIGLIEVMGLAVLPARLKSELEDVKNHLLGIDNKVIDHHVKWASEISVRYGNEITSESVDAILREEVGQKFLRVLMDAGVFKRDAVGQEAFRNFIHMLNP